MALVSLLSLIGCDPGDVGTPSGSQACLTDIECNDGFCGWRADNSRICKSWSRDGDLCGGLVAPEDRFFCEPSLTCLQDDPTGDAPGVCVRECSVNADCIDSFCGFLDCTGLTCGPTKICKAFGQEGDMCGGLVQPHLLHICSAGLICVNTRPSIPDYPRTCELP